MKCLFDPRKHHLSVWLWIYDPTCPLSSSAADRPEKPSLTPLHYAAVCGLRDVATFLILERWQDFSSQFVIDVIIHLRCTSEFGHADFAQVLLEHQVEHGADITAEDDDTGRTPLCHASYHGHAEVARLLLEHGADREAQDRDEKRTPLLLASLDGHVGVARVLLEHGVDVEARDKYGWSPLELASKEGHLGLVQVLLKHGADVRAQDENTKNTPLHIASKHGRLAVARVLQEHGADLNAEDKDGQTPLHRAQGREVAQFLIDHGADANVPDVEGQTPLHIASKCGSVDIVRLLLEHGVDANARDANDTTPLHLASVSNYVYRIGRLIDVRRPLFAHGSARDDEMRVAEQKRHETERRITWSWCDDVGRTGGHRVGCE